MVLHTPRAAPLILLTLLAGFASAQDDHPFDCKVSVGDQHYDLNPIAGEHNTSRETSAPPSTIVETLQFNLCTDLKKHDGIPDDEQCPSGTRACLTKAIRKKGLNDPVFSVVQLATSSSANVTSSLLSNPKGLSLKFAGPPYPTSGSESTPQTFIVELECSDDRGNPKLASYDGKEMRVTWSAPEGCAQTEKPPKDGDEKPPNDDGGDKSGDNTSGGGTEEVGSGVGYFFLLLMLAFVAYFALGAYYNYSTYGASGMDLIPHRDFWREVPYMLRDVVSHLCAAVRPRHTSSRGGYIAV